MRTYMQALELAKELWDEMESHPNVQVYLVDHSDHLKDDILHAWAKRILGQPIESKEE
jgi:hypothetical protein